MKKIAVFGKPANGKSTLSKKLALATGIKLYALDSILYKPNGEQVDRKSYEDRHERILSSEEWIIEGFGPMNSLESFNKRLEEADTLIYIELPYFVTYWLVTKRFLKGLFIKPEGWPCNGLMTPDTLIRENINEYQGVQYEQKTNKKAISQSFQRGSGGIGDGARL